MDPLSRKLLKELEEMQQQTGRMLRNMSISSMSALESGSWQPAVDIYESENEFFVYFDIAGADASSFSLDVDSQQVKVQGRRLLPSQKSIACVHQLEIELGSFERSIVLPGPVEVEEVTSRYTNGILSITLPKKKRSGRITVEITTGDE